MRAAIEAFDAGSDVALLSKLHPTRSHSGRGRGRHQRGARQRLRGQPRAARLRHGQGLRLPRRPGRGRDPLRARRPTTSTSSRTGARSSRAPTTGRIAQRPFGAAGAPRTAYAADITGHVLIQVLYEQVVKRDDPGLRGVLRLEARRGRRPLRRGDRLGSAARRPARRSRPRRRSSRPAAPAGSTRGTTNAYACTGDGMAMALRAGVALKDMEMMQFHPTTLAPDRGADHRGLPRRGRLPAQQATASAS